MTHSEVLLWMNLKSRQLHGERFLRQYSVDQYVLSFYCPRLKLALEVDGGSHFAVGAKENDEHREQHIGTYGIHFLRFTNAEIYNNLDRVLQSIYQQVESLGKTRIGVVPAEPPMIPHSHRRGETAIGGAY